MVEEYKILLYRFFVWIFMETMFAPDQKIMVLESTICKVSYIVVKLELRYVNCIQRLMDMQNGLQLVHTYNKLSHNLQGRAHS